MPFWLSVVLPAVGFVAICLFGLAYQKRDRVTYSISGLTTGALLYKPPDREALLASSLYCHPAYGKRLTYSEAGVIARSVLAADIPPEVTLGVIEIESGFRPRANSRTGCLGLMQVSRTAARAVGTINARALTDDHLFDIDNNIRLGTLYLRLVHRGLVESGLEDPEEFHTSLLAYNIGPTAARSVLRGRTSTNLRYYSKVRSAIRSWRTTLSKLP